MGRGVLCTYISPKKVCDSGVKNRGWGWKSGQKETLSGHFVRKVSKSALELGNVPQEGTLPDLGVIHDYQINDGRKRCVFQGGTQSTGVWLDEGG